MRRVAWSVEVDYSSGRETALAQRSPREPAHPGARRAIADGADLRGSAQAKFIRHIGENSSISQADLARATSSDPALTGRVVATLVEHGWVRRTRSQEDRREYVVELTAAGRRIRARVMEAREQVAKRLVAVLDDRDLDDVARVGKKIVDLLDESGSGDESVGPRRP